jgi:uncharacterized glyoxalase superfamily protein PhnB
MVIEEVNPMIFNHSVPADTLLPHVVYPDVAEAIGWLTKAFGFTEHYRYGERGGVVNGAQMHLANAWVMLERARPGSVTPAQTGYKTQSLTVFLEDVDSHFQKAKSAGARIVEELHVTEYGERQYGVEDLAGHHWLFSRHASDVSPGQWGAVVSSSAMPTPQISPMLAASDGNAAIEFYKTALDATILWRLGSGHVVAGLSVHGAPFFLASESPEYGTRGPSAAGFTTVRIELFVSDPVAVHRRMVAAGAVERSPVIEHMYSATGSQPITKMLQGSVVDPFGHMWLIGKFLE